MRPLIKLFIVVEVLKPDYVLLMMVQDTWGRLAAIGIHLELT